MSIIKETKGPIEFIEAVRIACKSNEQLAAYFGKKLTLRDNWKLRAVLDMLLNNPSIKPVSDKRVVLLWTGDANSQVERSSHGNSSAKTGSSCDVCDVCDGDLCSANLSKVVETDLNMVDREKDVNSTRDCHRRNYQRGESEYFKAASHTSHTSHPVDPATDSSKELVYINDKANNNILPELDRKVTGGSSTNLGQIHPDLSKTNGNNPQLEPSGNATSIHGFACYYCDFDTNSQDDYERHVVIYHQKKPGYPNLEDLKKSGLKPQGRLWEI